MRGKGEGVEVLYPSFVDDSLLFYEHCLKTSTLLSWIYFSLRLRKLTWRKVD